MAASSTLLCIHRDPVQLDLLKENGYALITATTGSDGLRLLMSRSVDAIVLEYHLGLLDGIVVADEIKQVRPQLPIVMVVDYAELSQGALKSVDVLVAKSDGPHSLLATIHAIFRKKPSREYEAPRAKGSTTPVGVNMPNPSKRQILVVDDDPAVRESLALLLISAGYDVATATDGFSALLHLRKTLPDVIVSDLDMPEMSGFELLSVVRRRFPRILSLAMSGAYPSDEVPPDVIADGFYAKGGHPTNLFKTLKQLISSAPARGSAHEQEIAPVWVPRNGNDSHGMPYVMLTCTECLRIFPLTVVEENAGRVLAVPCLFCPATSQYIIQPSSHGGRALVA
jgi:CheY-like chemotaxis protein